jgi:hypothetical protein
MALQLADVVSCGCGFVLWGNDDEELLIEAERHVRSTHPELLGTLSPLELARPALDGEAA